MKLLSKDQILGKDDRAYKDVEVREWLAGEFRKASKGAGFDVLCPHVYDSKGNHLRTISIETDALTNEEFVELVKSQVGDDEYLMCGKVRLRAMSSADRDDYEGEAYLANKEGGAKAFKNLRARLVAKCVDRDYADNHPYALQAPTVMGKRSAAVINRLFDVCRELNGLTAADVEELEGN